MRLAPGFTRDFPAAVFLVQHMPASFTTQYAAQLAEFTSIRVKEAELKAKDDSVTYPKRVTYVDKQTFVPLKQELYALSGMLLKTWTMSDVKERIREMIQNVE